MLDDLYGKGTYALAGMTATLTPGRPVVKLKASGSEVTTNISISATANIKKDGKNMLTVQPKLLLPSLLRADKCKRWQGLDRYVCDDPVHVED